MVFLIDGYNLMFAAGLATPQLGKNRLKAVRAKMLDWLARDSKDRGVLLRVVFDAQNGPAASPETSHKGVRVRFAYQQTADDVIEHILAKETLPGKVTVISNDTRLHEAARRRGCRAWSCERLMDWLATGEIPPKDHAPPPPEKPEGPDPDPETMLKAFAMPKARR